MTKRPESHAAVNAKIGARIRTARNLIGKPQQFLADKLGLTFQQVQKYENGLNAIVLGHLLKIAAATNLPLSWFLQDLVDNIDTPSTDAILTFTSNPRGCDLAMAFNAMRLDQQQALTKLAQTMVSK